MKGFALNYLSSFHSQTILLRKLWCLLPQGCVCNFFCTAAAMFSISYLDMHTQFTQSDVEFRINAVMTNAYLA